MSTVGPLIEYILAAERPGGGHLVKMGGISIQVPIFPAGLSISTASIPTIAAYASIQYYVRWSPAMVPNAFEIAVTHAGLLLDLGFVNRAMIQEGHNAWLILTEKEPAIMTLTNISGVDQMFEAEFAYLMVDTADDLALVNNIVKGWGSSKFMEAVQGKTNELLEQLIAITGGTEMLPRPPATGSIV